MAFMKVVAGASLFLFALVAAPIAQAQNDGDGTTVTRPHKVIDPAKRAARRAKRKHRREMQRQMQQQQGSAPSMPSGPASN